MQSKDDSFFSIQRSVSCGVNGSVFMKKNLVSIEVCVNERELYDSYFDPVFNTQKNDPSCVSISITLLLCKFFSLCFPERPFSVLLFGISTGISEELRRVCIGG